MNSRVHPNHKAKYCVENWTAYERGLVRRGGFTVWLTPGAISAWSPSKGAKPGGQRKYSGLAIETALTLRCVLGFPLRQAEGFLCSIFGLMGVGVHPGNLIAVQWAGLIRVVPSVNSFLALAEFRARSWAAHSPRRSGIDFRPRVAAHCSRGAVRVVRSRRGR